MNKRQFLSFASISLLPLLASRAFAQNSELSQEMKILSEYMAQAVHEPLPLEVVTQAKFHLLDTYAAIISGSQLPPGQAGINFIKKFAGLGGCTVIGTPYKRAAIDAAMANGMMGHADETDDSHNRSRSHPGCSVVPAATAGGETFQINGYDLLKAVTLGYDVGTRVLMAMGGPEFSYSSHKSSHSIAGVFGSAAAAGCTAQLTSQQMRWLMDYTSQQSSGIYVWGRDTDHIEKAFVFGGMPSKNGVTSALVVDSGWNGVNDVFSGADNFFMAYAPEGNKSALVDGLGERFEIANTDIKKWTVGSPIQGPLDALDSIRNQHSFDVNQVARVKIRLEPSTAKVVNNREIPDICLQHMIAIMLLDKTVSFKAAHDIARMKDSRVLEQRAKIELIPDDSLKQFMPIRVAIVEVSLADGRVFTQRIDSVRGTPRNPMTEQEIVFKANDLIAPVLGDKQAGKLIEAVLHLEKLGNIKGLSLLLQKNSHV
jgi:2-methylcitrate dehydratase PrpD